MAWPLLSWVNWLECLSGVIGKESHFQFLLVGSNSLPWFEVPSIIKPVLSELYLFLIVRIGQLSCKPRHYTCR